MVINRGRCRKAVVCLWKEGCTRSGKNISVPNITEMVIKTPGTSRVDLMQLGGVI